MIAGSPRYIGRRSATSQTAFRSGLAWRGSQREGRLGLHACQPARFKGETRRAQTPKCALGKPPMKGRPVTQQKERSARRLRRQAEKLKTSGPAIRVTRQKRRTNQDLLTVSVFRYC